MNRPIGSQSIPSRGATAGRGLRWAWASLASAALACTALKEGDIASPDGRDGPIDASTADATAMKEASDEAGPADATAMKEASDEAGPADAPVITEGDEAVGRDVTEGDREAAITRCRAGDYDGDGMSDLSFWRPNDGSDTGDKGAWYVLPRQAFLSQNHTSQITAFGTPGDAPVPADYDGDCKTDLALWRPRDPQCGVSGGGAWYILFSGDGSHPRPPAFGPKCTPFGDPGDVPVPADYDGDGMADIAVWRPTSGGGENWRILYAKGGSSSFSIPTTTGDVPVPADYDGDGKADIAYWRPSNHIWYIKYSSGDPPAQIPMGNPGDLAIPGDYDGDGKADVAVWSPQDPEVGGHGGWHIDYSGTGSPTFGPAPYPFGELGDVPVPADYDGDGTTDLAIWRAPDPLTGQGNAGYAAGWYFAYSSSWPRVGTPFPYGQPLDVVPANVQSDLGCYAQTGPTAPGKGCSSTCTDGGHSNGGYCPFSDRTETYDAATCWCNP